MLRNMRVLSWKLSVYNIISKETSKGSQHLGYDQLNRGPIDLRDVHCRSRRQQRRGNKYLAAEGLLVNLRLEELASKPGRDLRKRRIVTARWRLIRKEEDQASPRVYKWGSYQEIRHKADTGIPTNTLSKLKECPAVISNADDLDDKKKPQERCLRRIIPLQ